MKTKKQFLKFVKEKGRTPFGLSDTIVFDFAGIWIIKKEDLKLPWKDLKFLIRENVNELRRAINAKLDELIVDQQEEK